MSNNQHRSGFSHIGEGIAWALIWLSILLGIGGCFYIAGKKGNEPLIIIEHRTK